ncbi:putative dolichyl pyrophosphate Man9GlcNAc2 alpha-1,3-glucosyltransferase [Golovinomyces cichoracearum]|uniref:Alpha-1,3-glucosyltransferase n=1 Tax=Golovinomyces cichoracearum TaxID=62708 RepID=A0A420IWJ1_9PEZI|nr:putative dolichyl pyrophosphate Man9GlcNAc2 alpha-1,3-glucosyltransferase [Golovinomyces cichoracearum]
MLNPTLPEKSQHEVRDYSTSCKYFFGNKFPLASFLWPTRNLRFQGNVLILILLVVGLFRWAAGLWGYSGFQNPPRFGDYEAQRHWMEITTQLPISQWYFHDLEWWGLDYPPLTAYHSWVLGKLGSQINPEWFTLYSSRGTHDPNLKIYMRATVILSEYLVYIPAIILFVQSMTKIHKTYTWNKNIALTAILLQPGTILIDHVHFQYNTVMLGFVVACVSCLLERRLIWGYFFFVLALGFKQMALFYAPAIFAYLLGCCIFPKINFGRFFSILVATLASSTILVLPFTLGILYNAYRGIDIQPIISSKVAPLPIFKEYSHLIDIHAWYFPILLQYAQILHRIFPFARGLFEDKVANIWCALNVVVKLKGYPQAILQQLSFLATLAAIIPPCLIIFFKPRKTALPLALATTAWAFYLFGFQVHEKSVLLPLMPMTLLLATDHGLSEHVRAWAGFANLLGVWTMFPLLQRVHLRIPYFVLSLLWAYLLGLPPTSFALYFGRNSQSSVGLPTSLFHTSYYILMGLWHVAEAFVIPPLSKPDLWAVINVEIGAMGFSLCYIWCLCCLIEICTGLANPFRFRKIKRSTGTRLEKLKNS